MSRGFPSATVLMSGGIDSAACAHHLSKRGLAVQALFVDYGQAAAELEEKAVTAMTMHLGLRLRKINLVGTDRFGPGELVGRNAFLIFTALFVTSGKPGLLGLGLHAGTPYYDCSEAFVAAMGKLVAEHTDARVGLVAPFVTWTKKDVCEYFLSESLPLTLTYSCEAGTDPACGRCASCRDREALGC